MELEQINAVHLSNLLKKCESDILEGKQKLSLTASLLQKINYALQLLEYDCVSFSNPTTKPDEPIKFLQELIHKTPKLTVSQRIKRETWRVDISRFNNLKYLELCRIPMHLVEGMHSLHSKLQVLICERCTDCLEEILGTSNNVWKELRTAKLCYNDFVLLCPFTNTPWLQYLDLSYNRIEDSQCLQTLTNLKYLNLSYNFLTSVPILSEGLCHKLQVLLINNNYIQDLLAISVLDSLECLDVSNNLLADHSAISPILCLPNLRILNLLNNPISYHPQHRFHTCSYLNKGVIPNEFILDGELLNILEQKEIGRRGETQQLFGMFGSSYVSCLPSGSQNQNLSTSVVKKKVRDVVIEEAYTNTQQLPTIKATEPSQEHLQTKKQVEELRQRFGGDHWLHSQAGSYIQDLMGIENNFGIGIINTSTPLDQDIYLPPSPIIFPSIDKADNVFDSSASEDYVTALTTQAIIEKIPQNPVASTSEEATKYHKEPLVSNEFFKTELPNPNKEGLLNKPLPEFERQTERTSDELSNEEMIPLINEEQENEDGELWLVQKHREDGGLVELFLILTEKEIREKCTVTGRTTTKWSLESVESCEKVNNEPPTIHITFKTIRKAFRERTYIMEYSDAQELLKKVRSFLEAQSLSAMQQLVYRCMKCSTLFSVETEPHVLSTTLLENGTVENKPLAKCPTCRSTLVVQLDEPPWPVSEKKLASSQISLQNSSSDCSIGSAASLEQGVGADLVGGSVKEETPTPRRYDSDIEVISSHSQSSIEILEVQARLQGGITMPCRKWSNEERLLVAVPQLNTVPEIHPNATCLTESSSSGSLTDSVCTAYESNPVPVRRVGMSNLPEESTPTPTPNIIYNSLLEELIQNVTPKLSTEKSTSADSSFSNNVQFFFEDFSQVDHRIKLYLYQNTFKENNEELLFLLRVQLVISEEQFPGCLVFSTHSMYILHVIGSETVEDPSEWLQLKMSHRLAEISTIYVLPWDLGAGFLVGSKVYLALLCDTLHTSNFFKYLDSLAMQDSTLLRNIRVDDQPSYSSEIKLQQLVLSSVPASEGPVDCNIRHFALCSYVHTTKNSVKDLSLQVAPLLVTTTELLILKPNFYWLLFFNEPTPQTAAGQKLANIIEISLIGMNLQIQFLKEPENEEEVWNLELSNVEAVNMIIESIRGPWEQLFSVPLQLSIKN